MNVYPNGFNNEALVLELVQGIRNLKDPEKLDAKLKSAAEDHQKKVEVAQKILDEAKDSEARAVLSAEAVKKREQAIAAKEKQLKEVTDEHSDSVESLAAAREDHKNRERELSKREQDHARKEKDLAVREARLANTKDELDKQFEDLDKREAVNDAREKALAEAQEKLEAKKKKLAEAAKED